MGRMKELAGDIWDYYERGYWIVIPTNGFVKKNGACVMGRGLTKQAANRFPVVPLMVGEGIRRLGNIPQVITTFRIVTFPVKHNWWEKADIQLIEDSCKKLVEIVNRIGCSYIYLPRLGCGNGRLDWRDVKPVLENYFDARFIVVERE